MNEQTQSIRTTTSTKAFQPGRQIVFVLGIGLLIAVLTLSTILWKFQKDHAQTIFPGVSVAGIDLSDLTLGQAVVEINSKLTYGRTGQIQFHSEENRWVYTPEELGFSYNPVDAANQAFEVGRNKGFFANLKEQLGAYRNGVNITPGIVYDQSKAYTIIQEIARQSDIQMVEPSISLEQTDIRVIKGQEGQTVDVKATLARIQPYFLVQQNGSVDLVVEKHIPTTVNVEETARLAEAILSQPFTIQAANPDVGQGPWVLEPQNLAALITIAKENDQSGDSYQLNLNRSALEGYISRLAPSLQTEPVNARMIFNDNTRELELIAHAVAGQIVDVERSVDEIITKIQNGEHQANLIMKKVDPDVKDDSKAADLGITELVAETTSYYYGSDAARVQNIRASAASFHGVFVAPGEVFSMAKYLTNISLENGYAEAPIIVGDQTVDGIGGGICQVSTTLFRNAFFGGFPIVERHPHAYRVGYYEQQSNGGIDLNLSGLDATVYVPLVDLKFRNDSDHWLLMETYATDTSLTWKFYSTGDGREVRWWTTGLTDVVPPPDPIYREDPTLPTGTIKQVDWEVYGATVIAYRTVSRNGEVFINDTIRTVYAAWPAGYNYGPGTDIP
jgi:vancomycin resistance protein YoaR